MCYGDPAAAAAAAAAAGLTGGPAVASWGFGFSFGTGRGLAAVRLEGEAGERVGDECHDSALVIWRMRRRGVTVGNQVARNETMRWRPCVLAARRGEGKGWEAGCQGVHTSHTVRPLTPTASSALCGRQRTAVARSTHLWRAASTAEAKGNPARHPGSRARRVRHGRRRGLDLARRPAPPPPPVPSPPPPPLPRCCRRRAAQRGRRQRGAGAMLQQQGTGRRATPVPPARPQQGCAWPGGRDEWRDAAPASNAAAPAAAP
eukprot:364571-Chlamydomonas_euryale.AAC.1